MDNKYKSNINYFNLNSIYNTNTKSIYKIFGGNVLTNNDDTTIISDNNQIKEKIIKIDSEKQLKQEKLEKEELKQEKLEKEELKKEKLEQEELKQEKLEKEEQLEKEELKQQKILSDEDNCFIDEITEKLNHNIVGNNLLYDIFYDDTERLNNLYLILVSHSYSGIKKIRKVLNDEISSEVIFFDYEKFGRKYGIKLNKKQFVNLLKKVNYETFESKKCYKKLVNSSKIKYYSDYLYYNKDNIMFFDFN